MNLVRATLDNDAPTGYWCGFEYEGDQVGFRAFLDMRRGDKVAINTEDGQVYAILRPGEGVIYSEAMPPSI